MTTNPEKKQEVQTTDSQENMTMDQLFAEQEAMQKKLNKKEIVNVKVVQISQDNILVDTGDKKEGLIAVSDFEGRPLPAIGSQVTAILIRKGSDERPGILSHKRALETLGWDTCKTAFENKTRVKGTVAECVKGGYKIDVYGVSGFMPLSLSELHPAYKHYLPKGAKIKAVIAEFSKDKQKLILSRKQVLEEDEFVRRDQVLGEVKEGEILRVVVAKVGKDCLYLRFHGIEGVVSLDNIAWREQETLLNSYRRGQRIKAKLLSVDKEKGVMNFGIKQLFLNPAELLKKRYPYMSNVKGIITKITPEKVEVELGKNKTKGYISEFELGRDFNAKEGDVVQAAVIGVDGVAFTVNLSVKRFDQVQNRKVVAQYLKQAPRPTLGQLLQGSLGGSMGDGEDEPEADIEEEAQEEQQMPEPQPEAREPKTEEPEAENKPASAVEEAPKAEVIPAAEEAPAGEDKAE